MTSGRFTWNTKFTWKQKIIRLISIFRSHVTYCAAVKCEPMRLEELSCDHNRKCGSAGLGDYWLSSISMRRRSYCCLIAISMALLFIIFICGSIGSHVSLRVNITCVFSFRNHRGICLSTVVRPSNCYFEEYHSSSTVQVHKPWYYGGTMVNPG